MNQSYTLPMLANGHSKPGGLSSLYTLPRPAHSFSRPELDARRDHYATFTTDCEETKVTI